LFLVASAGLLTGMAVAMSAASAHLIDIQIQIVTHAAWSGRLESINTPVV
jgi:hypothetical protein